MAKINAASQWQVSRSAQCAFKRKKIVGEKSLNYLRHHKLKRYSYGF